MMDIEFPEIEPGGDVFGNGKVSNRLAPETEPLTPAESRVLDIRTLQKDRAQTMRGYPLITFDEMDVETPEKPWLIKNILARRETSAWIAPPGAMKSALLAQAAICVGAGLDWHGYRNKGAAGVVYFAIERADLVKKRLRAHRRILGLVGTPICVSSATIDLTKPDAFKKVIDTIADAKTIVGVDIGMVIIDTFAKLIAAAAGDENSAKDQGAVFANVQRVKNHTGVHVALIGHTGKDESRGARGSNALLGDVDVMVTISGDDIKTATVTKANDAPEGPLFSFKSEIFDFGIDEDGDPITVNVVSSETVSETAVKRRDKWPKGLKLVRDSVAEAIDAGGTPHTIRGDGPSVTAVSVSAARAIHSQRYISNGDGDRNEAERKAWARNFKAARTSNLIGGELREGQELIWLVA
ncbi:MAG: AAA family ATPase [Hyphomicrobium sp.]|jgi:hypothetical protein